MTWLKVKFGDAGFPAADEVIGPGLYGPVVSVAVVLQCEGVPILWGWSRKCPVLWFLFVSVPGAVCISADAEEVIGIEEPVYPQGGVPLDASCVFQSGVVHGKASLYCFPLVMESSTSVMSASSAGRSFMDTSEELTRFICSSPCSRRRMFRMSPSLMGNAFFHGMTALFFAVDDFMQPAELFSLPR